MTELELYQLELVKAQTALALKQAKTAFWKVGIAAMAAGAVIGGFLASVW